MPKLETWDEMVARYERSQVTVPGFGPSNADVMIIGEAPGREEVAHGLPFVGRSGQELTRYLRVAGIRRADIYITNVVKYLQPGNADPTTADIKAGTAELLEEIRNVQPRVIMTLGRVATRWALGVCTMDHVHGITYRAPSRFGLRANAVVVPCYHPALGLYQPGAILNIQADFRAAARTFTSVRQGLTVLGRVDVKGMAEDSEYDMLGPDSRMRFPCLDTTLLKRVLRNEAVVAVDTETVLGEPWCLSFSVESGCAYVVRVDDLASLKIINAALQTATCVLHNALFDLAVLAKMGVHPQHVEDTMIMAHLLGDEPKGLKALAYRHADLYMHSYKELIQAYSDEKQYAYMVEVAAHDWPPPPIVVEWKYDKRVLRQPQALRKRVERALLDYFRKPGVDLAKRWNAIDGREIIERTLGPFPEGTIADVWEQEPDRVVRYSARDADATLQVWRVLKGRIEREGLAGTYQRDCRALLLLTEIEKNGVPIDVGHIESLREDWEDRRAILEWQIQQEVNQSLNPGSSKQVAEVLFRLGVITSPNVSTRDADLQMLMDRHPVVALIRQWRSLNKLLTTYIPALTTHVDPDGRIRPEVRVTSAVTGRLSMARPNLMAVPARSAEGQEFRRAIRASPGHSILALDYSQIEMRVAAHVSQDSVMCQVFRDGEDLHARTAARIFHLAIEDVDPKKHRYPAKRIGFGILYGITSHGLAKQLADVDNGHWTEQRCAELITAWYQTYTGVRTWADQIIADVQVTGEVRDMFGRRLWVPEVFAASDRVRAAGLRQAVNGPVQMGAQGVIKEAMGRVPAELARWRAQGVDVRLLLQVHDELVFEVDTAHAEDVGLAIAQIMADAVPLRVPVAVDVELGPNWADLDEIAQVVNAEVIT